MEQMFDLRNYKVSYLIERIDMGILGLPELQRPFVWDNKKVCDLFDSMHVGYPVGYLMLWECSRPEKSKAIGTGEKNYETKEVIIDGQQRLTSLYAVMKGKTVIDAKYKEREIIISYSPLHDEFRVGNAATKKSPEWIYNISELFKLENAYDFINDFIRGLSNEVSNEKRSLIVKNISELFALKEYQFPIFMIKSNASEENVSEVFVRINSQGINLTEVDFILTLLSVHWDEGRRQVDKFCRESLKPEPNRVTSYNSIGIKIQAKNIIVTAIAYAFNRAKLEYGRKMLKGDDLQNRGMLSADIMKKNFDILKDKLPDVMNVTNWHEFLKAIMNAGYRSDNMILSKNAIYYTYAMYLIAKYRFNAANEQNRDLASLWFFHAALYSLYSNSPETVAESHLTAIKNCSSLEEYKRFIISRVEGIMTNDYFSVTLCGTDGLAVSMSGSGNNAWFAYVAALNILNRKVLFSTSNLTLPALMTPGTDGKKKSLEKHHLFPKAYLKTLKYRDKNINQMANYAFIDWNDNLAILDEAPSIYYPEICKGRTPDEINIMEQENALPHNWQNMSYEDFLESRRKLMAKIIKQGFEALKSRI